uniref:Uncharacterized protein n=1 Tax=Anguilla anguilla TaxID=7936 RepID=A0A0E9VSF7_ANGAN
MGALQFCVSVISPSLVSTLFNYIIVFKYSISFSLCLIIPPCSGLIVLCVHLSCYLCGYLSFACVFPSASSLSACFSACPFSAHSVFCPALVLTCVVWGNF